MRTLSGSYGVGYGRWRRFWSSFDWPLLMTVLMLTGLGIANLFSATHQTAHAGKFTQQLVWCGLGLSVYFVVAAIDYKALYRAALLLLGVGLLAVLLTYLFSPAKGAARWLDLGGFTLQPSEFTKLAVIVALARLFQDIRDRSVSILGGVVTVFLLVNVVAAVMLQPDLGTASLTALIIVSMCFLLMKRLWPMAVASVLALIAVPFAWGHLHDYQKFRILAFLDSDFDPTGKGWHAMQSVYAVGSGRFSGKGFLQATQNRFGLLPEHWTDFPFSVWAEEWGFLGAFALLLLFAFLIMWIIGVGLKARDVFGASICFGVAAMLFWHVIVNVAMVVRLAPVVGVTLPLVSYGGSSILAAFLGLGLVASVSMRRHAP